ncbi:S8 family serine peptidase [Pontibacterium sp.]|uniref:subtilisin-like serine protease QhpE n=1 Tax=Pontibacterium sp. TaxID=2036026 RepID=UPI00356A26D7
MAAIKVGVVDSGFLPRQADYIQDSAAFIVQDDSLWQDQATEDQLAHGTKICDVIHRISPDSKILLAQVFRARFTTTALQVSAAIRWLTEQEVNVINLSLGLRTDRPQLREAVADAIAAGVLICASSPAKGEPVYPSAYPGVLRTTGDARCTLDEWSMLNTQYADIGAHVRCLDGSISGASIGTAYVAGHIAKFMSDHPHAGRKELGHYLKNNASYFGAERRGPDEVWTDEDSHHA